MSQSKIYLLGPCAAETETQVRQIAQEIHTCFTPMDGEIIFRAGIWKPRTSPDTFQGIGNEGLAWLSSIQKDMGMKVATEVITPEHVGWCLDAGIRHLWVGARTSANPNAVQALADAMDGRVERVYVKNPVNEDAPLWEGNIQRFENKGIPTMAIHRGCRHKPCWHLAHYLKTHRPNTDILLDPSHMSGNRQYIATLLNTTKQLPYSGLMVELHSTPDKALSDAKQQMLPKDFMAIYQACGWGETIVNNDELQWLRHEIDELDDELWQTILRRMEVSQQIGQYKQQQGMPIVQPTRFQEILSARLEWGKQHHISDDLIRQIMDAIHQESIRKQQ